MQDLIFLNDDERELLIGLALMIVAADGSISKEESKGLRLLGQAMGAGTFVEAARRARTRFADDEVTLAAARALTGSRARATIHGVLRRIAEADALSQSEHALLTELAAMWELTAK